MQALPRAPVPRSPEPVPPLSLEGPVQERTGFYTATLVVDAQRRRHLTVRMTACRLSITIDDASIDLRLPQGVTTWDQAEPWIAAGIGCCLDAQEVGVATA